VQDFQCLFLDFCNLPAHCWSWQWKWYCFPWGSPWRHSDWCEAHGCQLAVQ